VNFGKPISPTLHFMKLYQAGLELLQVDQWSDRHSEAVMYYFCTFCCKCSINLLGLHQWNSEVTQ